MVGYPQRARERAMKVEEVILRVVGKRLTFWQAAWILRISPRHLRRVMERYRRSGFDGLLDRRKGRPSPRRVPWAVAEQVLCLYRDKYFDFSVRHFHEKLREEHGIHYSYTCIKRLLRGAGLVVQARKRGPHRRKRERRPMSGMLLHIDASKHRWLGGEQRQDLLVILDDATSEIYYAQLVEEESTPTALAALREVVEQRGIFCALYTDRGSHFWLTPKAGEIVDRQRMTQIGRAMRELDIEMIPAYSPQARGRSARTFGTWQGRLPQELRVRGITTVEEANRFLRESYIAELNRKFSVPAAQPESAVVPANRTLQIERTKWRGTLAKCRVLVCEHLEGTWSVFYGPHLVGRYAQDGSRYQSTESTFLERGNPAPPAGFPLSTATPVEESADPRTGHIMC